MTHYRTLGLFFSLLIFLSTASATTRSTPVKTLNSQNIKHDLLDQRNPGDTIFFDDFESGAAGWTSMDVVNTDTFWHIDILNAYQGNSFWCGTMARPNWINPNYGYGDEWAQFLESPEIDLGSVTGDTALLTFAHRPSNEVPSGGYPGPQWDGWDCITVWISTDDGTTWNPIKPDTTRWPNTYYNIKAAWSYYYNYLAGEFDSVPGWGWGPNMSWSDVGFDLTPYIGGTVRIRFTGFSDPAESDESGSGSYSGMWNLDNIRVYDNLNNTYYYEDCESGMGQWNAHPTNPLGDYWHLTNLAAHSPANSYGCFDSLTGQFPLTGTYCALVSPYFDLSDVSTGEPCLLDFYLNYAYLNPYGDDGYRIELSSDKGMTWYNATGYYYNGSTNGSWIRFGQQYPPGISLDNLVGQDSVLFRIVTWTHRVSTPGSGFFVDDCIVTGKFIEFPTPEQVLIYDDDLGAQDVYGFGWEKYYESSLANIGYRCTRISEADNGIPDSLYLRQNGMVIWNLGPRGWKYLPENPINDAALQNLYGYLRMGGKLLLVGEDFLYNNFPCYFADSILLITTVTDDIGCDSAVGISGDPISDGLNCPIDFNHLNGNNYGLDYTDDVITSATPVFLNNRSSNPSMLRTSAGSYRAIFSAFPIEAITSFQLRDTLISRIINWIDPYPPAPNLITASPHPPTGITVSWHPNLPQDLSGYYVYRARAYNGPYGLVGTAAPSETTFTDTLVLLDSLYYYGVKAYDPSAQLSGMSRIVSTVYQVGIKEEVSRTVKPHVTNFTARPNPFHTRLDIMYSLSGKLKTTLKVYDSAGRMVRDLTPVLDACSQNYCVPWFGTDISGRQLSAGVYFIQLDAGDVRLTEKTVLLK
jgi:hypothetical protein